MKFIYLIAICSGYHDGRQPDRPEIPASQTLHHKRRTRESVDLLGGDNRWICFDAVGAFLGIPLEQFVTSSTSKSSLLSVTTVR